MQGKTIVNVNIGAATIKVIHTEKKDSEFVIKNSAVLETGSNLFVNEHSLNIGFIEDKLRIFLFENKIKGGIINFCLPDYIIDTKVSLKQQVITNDYLSSIIKGKLLNDLIGDSASGYDNHTLFDCQIINKTSLNPNDPTQGSTDVAITLINEDIPKALKKMSKRLNMTPTILEPETNGFIRLINMFDIKDNYFVIDIGEIYTKIIIIYEKSSIEYHIIPSGIFKIDGLISSIYRCSSLAGKEKRITDGIITSNDMINNLINNFLEKTFSIPLIEHFDTIQDNYGGLQSVKKFLISGGAWNIPEFKNIIENQTLSKFDKKIHFEDFSQFCSKLTFDNDIVKEDILENINEYAPCVGLSLRGGI